MDFFGWHTMSVVWLKVRAHMLIVRIQDMHRMHLEQWPLLMCSFPVYRTRFYL